MIEVTKCSTNTLEKLKIQRKPTEEESGEFSFEKLYNNCSLVNWFVFNDLHINDGHCRYVTDMSK